MLTFFLSVSRFTFCVGYVATKTYNKMTPGVTRANTSDRTICRRGEWHPHHHHHHHHHTWHSVGAHTHIHPPTRRYKTPPCGQIHSTRNVPPSAGGRASGISRLSGSSCRSSAPQPRIDRPLVSSSKKPPAAAAVADPSAAVPLAAAQLAAVGSGWRSRWAVVDGVGVGPCRRCRRPVQPREAAASLSASIYPRGCG